MFWVNEGRGPRSGLGVVIAQLRVDLPILPRPRRIDNPEVLYGTPVHNPSNDEFTRAVSYLPVLRKVRVLDMPGPDEAPKDVRLVAQRRVRTHSLQCCNHVEAWVGRKSFPGFSSCGCACAAACPRKAKCGQQPHCNPPGR